MSRQLLARAWASTRLDPCDSPLSIDLDFDHLRDLWTGQGGSAPPLAIPAPAMLIYPLLAIACRHTAETC